MMNERISSIMTINVVTVTPEHTLKDVRDLLFDRHFHHLPVVEGPGKKLVGIITSWDLLKTEASVDDYSRIKVGEVMTRKVVTLHPNELVGAAALIFLRHLFHGIPIVNDDDELVGLVTTHDVLKYLYYKEYPNDEFARSLEFRPRMD